MMLFTLWTMLFMAVFMISFACLIYFDPKDTSILISIWLLLGISSTLFAINLLYLMLGGGQNTILLLIALLCLGPGTALIFIVNLLKILIITWSNTPEESMNTSTEKSTTTPMDQYAIHTIMTLAQLANSQLPFTIKRNITYGNTRLRCQSRNTLRPRA